MSSTNDPPLDKHPWGWFERAASYHIAADELLGLMHTSKKLPLRDPVYFLYHHAVELALKACLFAHGFAAPRGTKGHDITELFQKCKDHKLLSLPLDIGNLIGLLHAGDENDYRYRYVGPVKHFAPDLTWVRETVDQLFDAIKPHIDNWVSSNNATAPSTVRMVVTMSISDKRQPVPK